jgi:hypothetical protein
LIEGLRPFRTSWLIVGTNADSLVSCGLVDLN